MKKRIVIAGRHKNMRQDFGSFAAGTGEHCVYGHLGLVSSWSCFVFCLLFLLFYKTGRGYVSITRVFPTRKDAIWRAIYTQFTRAKHESKKNHESARKTMQVR